MTQLHATTTRPTRPSAAHHELRYRVGLSVMRARLLAVAGVGLLAFAAVLGGLFVVAVADALIPMGQRPRATALLALLLAACVGAGYRIVCALLDRRAKLAAAEQIDRAGAAQDQPVVRGLSLLGLSSQDPLAQSLIARAEEQAKGLAQRVEPAKAYPLRNLVKPGRWFALSCAAWLALAILFPSQFFGMLSRVALPWTGAPPFSLTQLEPTWTPDPPDAGQDVTISVTPEGKEPEQVDLVLLDEQGNEIDRYPMHRDEQGAFHFTLRDVQQPINFKLETAGRPTRGYTITPTPRPQQPPSAQDSGQQGDASDSGSDQGGSTSFDPDAVAQRDLENHPDWQRLQQQLSQLLDEMHKAQAQAQQLDPSDLEKMRAMEAKIGELIKMAGDLAGELEKMQASLPGEAAERLAKLIDALALMQCSGLGSCPNPGSGSGGQGTPSPGQWKDNAGQAISDDYWRIVTALGFSPSPTYSGTTSGAPAGSTPDRSLIGAAGTSDEQVATGDQGPLPEAVMQKVPPSYRAFIRAYFTQLAQPSPDSQDNSP